MTLKINIQTIPHVDWLCSVCQRYLNIGPPSDSDILNPAEYLAEFNKQLEMFKALNQGRHPHAKD